MLTRALAAAILAIITAAIALAPVVAANAQNAGPHASPLIDLLTAAPAAEAPALRIDTRTLTLAEAALAAERLADDVLVLSRIVALQERLLETNATRTGSGAHPFLLERRICTASPLATMCDALPLTFAPASGDQP